METQFRKKCRDVLRRIGLGGPAEKVWSYLCLASPRMICKEISYRIIGAPDKMPLPPHGLTNLVTGNKWEADFFDSGKLQMAQMINILRKNGINLAELHSILDFGCGCGRLIRHLSTLSTNGAQKLYCTDYNDELIEWCKDNLHFAEFDTNALSPPLKYGDSSFDFIFARSVFTHLSGDLQVAWINELRRILRTGGLLYFSIHGDRKAHELTNVDKELFRAGKLVIKNPNSSGMNKCAAYESKDYVIEKLLGGFELVDFIPGMEDRRLGQDVCLAKKLRSP